jgi:hypothetical protein
MASGLIIIPNYMPALDANGDPSSGAKMYFYLNNTTTPQLVYQDADLTTPHAQPVVAASDGTFPAIYALNTNVYSVAVTTYAGVPLSPVYSNITTATVVYGSNVYQTLAQAQAANIPAEVTRIATLYRTPTYAIPGTLIGGGEYKAVTDTTGYPASSYFTSVDGRTWLYDDQRDVNPDCLGAMRDSTTDCATAFNDACTFAYLTGRPIRPRAGGRYVISSAVTIRWGVSVIAEKGAVLYMAAGFNFVDPSVTVYPALNVFSCFRDVRFMPSAAAVPYAINAITDLNNSTGPGIICGLAVQDCQFIADPSMIVGYRASPGAFFFKGIYTYDVAYVDIRGNSFVGGFEISAPITAALDSCAFNFDGQTVRVYWSASNNVTSYCYAFRGQGAVEGFSYDGGEVVYCRYGIHVQSDTVKPGGYINGGHFNVSEAGVTLVNRNVCKVHGINVFTNTFYEARTTWTALKLDTCTDIVVSGLQTRPSFNAAWAGTSRGLWGVDSSRITVTGMTVRFPTQASIAGGYVVDIFNVSDSMFTNITGDTVRNGIKYDANCSYVTFGSTRFTNVTTEWSHQSTAVGMRWQASNANPDSTTTIVTGAGSETVSASTRCSILRRLQAGGGAYNYDITFDTLSAVPGAEFKMTLRFDSANPTCRIYDSSASLLLSINVASPTKYYLVTARYTGSAWKLIGASESLAIIV